MNISPHINKKFFHKNIADNLEISRNLSFFYKNFLHFFTFPVAKNSCYGFLNFKERKNMKINPITTFNYFTKCTPAFKGDDKPQTDQPKGDKVILDELDLISKANIQSSVKPKYALGLNHDELVKRTSKDAMHTYTMLDVDAPEYATLDEGDKNALVYLLRAGEVIDKIYYEMEDKNNIPFMKYLDNEISNGNEDAKMTKTLLVAQRGIFAVDNNSNKIVLAKDLKHEPGGALYPSDLSVDEFHSILIKMLKEGKKEKVAEILNQRSFVERDGDELKAVDYVDKFKDEFSNVADELEAASKVSTNEDFNEYLRLQAKALRIADPMLDAYADYKWATLQDTPLEFTITRECYDDKMTPSVYENSELKELLNKNDIEVFPKDYLGARIGIVNKNSTGKILRIKKYLPLVAKKMPLQETYEQNILKSDEVKQSMVDADIVNLFGWTANSRGGITQAENLPNGDKLSIRVLNGGKRNVYHRQIMNSGSVKREEYLNTMFVPELHKYYSPDSWLLFVAGHENGHSLGPKKPAGLANYYGIIDECKADLVSVMMSDVLNEAGLYSNEEKNQILFRFVQRNILKTKPLMSQTHRVRALMQMNYLMENNAVWIMDDGRINCDLDKVNKASNKMLEEIINIILSNDANTAREFIDRYYYWPDDMDKVSKNLDKLSKLLNSKINAPLSDKLLSEQCAH